jgi:hypothetical protein
MGKSAKRVGMDLRWLLWVTVPLGFLCSSCWAGLASMIFGAPVGTLGVPGTWYISVNWAKPLTTIPFFVFHIHQYNSAFPGSV